MKKIIHVLILSSFLFLHFSSLGQNWVNGGNALGANGSLGTTTNFSVIFKTNNTDRGRITNGGNWGIGTTSPASKLAVNSASGVSPFRAQVNGSTKLYVGSGGGVSIGSSSTPPANGLYVLGNLGIGTSTPSYKLHVVGGATITQGLYVQDYGTSTYNYSGSYGTYSYGSNAGVYSYGPSYGVIAYGTGSGSYGVYGSGLGFGVYGTTTDGYGVRGISTNSTGVYGSGVFGLYGSGTNTGVYGAGSTYGLDGFSSSGKGVYGYSSSGNGVYGESYSNIGGYFRSTLAHGIWAITTSTASNVYAGVFQGNVYTFGAYLTSDKNLKKNIQEFGDAMSIINKLKPKNYEFRNDGKYASLQLPKGNHYGLLAQDLELVLPGLVKEAPLEVNTGNNTTNKPEIKQPSPDGKTSSIKAEQQKETTELISTKAVNYIELIPIIIKAMQEQQATIDKQNSKIEALTQLVTQLQNKAQQGGVKLSGVSLGQNSPNPPLANSTRINYNIPSGSATAELIFTNAAGQNIRQIPLNSSGLVDIDTSVLSAGTYFYTLYVNGQSYDTKKMVITK